MESILPDLPPLPRRKITLPLSTLAEVARDVCDGYDPPPRRQAYAKAHPLWRELPSPLHPRRSRAGTRPPERPNQGEGMMTDTDEARRKRSERARKAALARSPESRRD